MINISKAHRENEVNQFATFPITYRENHTCSYCGSLSPSKVVEAIKQGIGISFADRKYGWPHKMYLDTAPKETIQIKFYTVHLRDATEEEAKIIANACGLSFKFDVESPGDVQWFPVLEENKYGN